MAHNKDAEMPILSKFNLSANFAAASLMISSKIVINIYATLLQI
jgi:hypothetical protein